MMRKLITLVIWTTAATAQSPRNNLLAPQNAPQSKPSGPPSLQRPGERPPEAAPTDAVITIKGLCPAQTGPATTAKVPITKDCTTSITRQQFESLLKSFNPNNQPVSQAQRKQIAQAYVQWMIFSEAAKAAGVENSETFNEVMRVLRMRTLAEVYMSQMSEQYRNPSQQDIEAYYNENASKFESAKLSRIYLPKTSPDPQASAGQKQDYLTKAQQVADDMQARAGKGENLDALEKEAYSTLGIKVVPPATELSPARHGMYPPKLDQEIFSHKAGEVFRSDDANGFIIYRVESRETAPLDSLKEEISREIMRRKLDERTKELTNPVHTDYDESYFGLPAAPAQPGRPQVLNPPK
jgi:hypothetical protein